MKNQSAYRLQITPVVIELYGRIEEIHKFAEDQNQFYLLPIRSYAADFLFPENLFSTGNHEKWIWTTNSIF